MASAERAKKYSDARHGQEISEGVLEVRRKKSVGEEAYELPHDLSDYFANTWSKIVERCTVPIRKPDEADEIFGHARYGMSIFAYVPILLS